MAFPEQAQRLSGSAGWCISQDSVRKAKPCFKDKDLIGIKPYVNVEHPEEIEPWKAKLEGQRSWQLDHFKCCLC